MSGNNEKLSALWDALRAAKSQHLAVDLIRQGVRSIDDLLREASVLIERGVSEADIQSVLQKCQPGHGAV